MGLFRTDGSRAPLQGKHNNASGHATNDLGGPLQLSVRGATGAAIINATISMCTEFLAGRGILS